MTEQQIKDRLAELYAAQEAAAGWGAAVGARHEEIRGLESQLAALQRSPTGTTTKPHIYSPDYQAMGDCRVCGHGPEKLWHQPTQGGDKNEAK